MPSIKFGALLEFEYSLNPEEETILYMRLGWYWDSIKYGEVADLVKFLHQYLKDTDYDTDERAQWSKSTL